VPPIPLPAALPTGSWPRPARFPSPLARPAALCQGISTSRSPYHDIAAQMGVAYFTDADDFCEEHPEVVILATSILSTESVSILSD